MKKNQRAIYAWSFYDWANSAFTTTVMAGFFPLFFKQYWANGMSPSESTFWLGMGNAGAGLFIALLAPLLGAMADQGGLKKRMLLSFAILGVLMTAGLFFATQGQWLMALLLYGFGSIAFSGANVFYDAMLVDVSEHEHLHRVSALGFGLGYIGGGLLFALNVWMTLNPTVLGMADAGEAVRWSFVSVAVWWAIFTIPLALWVKEPASERQQPLWQAASAGLKQLKETFKDLRSLRYIALFLLAYFLYIDGVNTIARMAVDYGLALGFESSVLITALLMTQFIAFPAAIAMGWLGEHWHAKGTLLICIAVYAVVCMWSSTMQNEMDFYWLAAAIGLVMGGVQSLSRSMYARMIPAHQSAEFFGFFNMLGKFAAVIGPALMGLVSMLTGSPRASMLAIVALFSLGGIILFFVKEEGVVRNDGSSHSEA
jgi:UMF1 family MFS transporter